MKLFALKDIYSIGVLLLLALGELFAIWGGAHKHCGHWEWVVLGIALILFLLLFIGYFKKAFRIGFPTFTKLLASAITPRPTSVVFLLGFVMHLSWMTDGVLNYIVGDEWRYPFFIGLLGILILWLAFPVTEVGAYNNKNVVFVSGISKIKVKTVSVNYDGEETISNVVLLDNLVPLVRILNLVFETKELMPGKVGKLLILSTRGNSIDEMAKDSNYKGNEVDDLMIDVTDVISNHDHIKNGLETIAGNKIVDADHNTKKVIRLDYHHSDIIEILTKIVRIAALVEYPQHEEFIQQLNIDFTQHQCDYDSFDDCFDALRKAVEAEDNKKQLLCFNLTPGTGIVGSLMTLFSIDNDRGLYYYAQHSDLPKEKRLRPVDKSIIPLENLLSQALQKIKNPL